MPLITNQVFFDPMNETTKILPKHLQTCRAVFQGGGVKAVSIIGGINEAYESGVLFSAVAGTSAGSIIAALIGAGASPEFLEGSLKSVKKSDILFSPETGVLKSNWHLLSKFLKIFSFIKFIDLLRNNITYGGKHSSKGIEIWIDDLLSELLDDCERPVKFKDLKKPTYIVGERIFQQQVLRFGAHLVRQKNL